MIFILRLISISTVVNMSLTKEQKDHLEKIYFDPSNPVSFSGLDKLWNALKKNNRYDISKRQLKDWLLTQDTYTSYFPRKINFKRPRTISPRTDYIWGSDVAYMLAFSDDNDDFAYFTVFIDLFSRFAYAEPLKSLQARAMLNAMQEVFSDRQPQVLFTDAGSEYVNRIVKHYLKSKNIRHYVSRNEKKVAHAERLIKQVKRKLIQYMKEKNTLRWIDVLQDVITAYNNSYHRIIRMTPEQARDQEKQFEVWNNQFERPRKVQRKKTADDRVNELQKSDSSSIKSSRQRKHQQKRRRRRRVSSLRSKTPFKFKVGDRVKVSALSRPFQREYNEKFSTETFTITDRRIQDGITSFSIQDEQKDPIIGWFYPQELLRVILPDDKKYKIEKILKKRTRNGKKELFVKFQGYPKKFNAWVSDVTEL